jgi:hypothetical protein
VLRVALSVHLFRVWKNSRKYTLIFCPDKISGDNHRQCCHFLILAFQVVRALVPLQGDIAGFSVKQAILGKAHWRRHSGLRQASATPLRVACLTPFGSALKRPIAALLPLDIGPLCLRENALHWTASGLTEPGNITLKGY